VGKAATLIDRLYFIARNFTLKWKLGLITKRIQTKSISGRKLLDVGSGTGEFLKIAKLGGWEVLGSEPSSEAIRHADPIIAENIKSSLGVIRDNGYHFDVITLWHVLEHIENLNATIQELKSMLTKSGTIYVAVPNHLSWDSQHYQNYWAGYDVPRHIWHFSKKNMNLLMSKHGLTVTDIIPMRLDAIYVSLLSEKYLGMKNLTISRMLKALVNGLRSNYDAQKTMEYSSLIYVVKNANH
jgi:2-polyprenyl-3-methyl-5-hydroxy-6-metoxy-1,4-benzoquinol methylase